jgi:hypothetical protein
MNTQPGAFARHFRCNCCNNPWNQTSEDSNAQPSPSIEICNPCLTDNKGYSGIDPNNFDTNISPSENFYLWSNGGWKAKNPIPAEYSSWNTFIVLRDLNLDRLRVILDDLNYETEGKPQDQDLKKLRDYYGAFMNEEAINQGGLTELQELIDFVCANHKVMIIWSNVLLHIII